MESVVLNICGTQPLPDVIYFAGRGDALAQFVELLGTRRCRTSPLTVVTGDDIDTLRDDVRARVPGAMTALGLGNLQVAYTGIAVPEEWGSSATFSPVVDSHFIDTCDTCWTGLPDGARVGDGHQLANEKLDDDAGIMGHDATAMAITAIRRVAGGAPGPGQEVSTKAVVQVLYQIRGAESLQGASGELSMSTCGEAENKVFPLLLLKADGTQTLSTVQTARGRLPC
jgi:hypothetical protein